MTRQERQLVAALVGDRRRWVDGTELGVVWAEVRRDGKRRGKASGKGKTGVTLKRIAEGKKWW